MKLTSAQSKIIKRTGFLNEPGGPETTNPGRTVRVLERLGLVAFVQNRTSSSDPLYALTAEGEKHVEPAQAYCGACGNTFEGPTCNVCGAGRA